MCSQEGYRVAECKANHSAKKTNTSPAGKAIKALPPAREIALQGMEVVEFTLLSKQTDGTPNPPDDDQGLTDTD